MQGADSKVGKSRLLLSCIGSDAGRFDVTYQLLRQAGVVQAFSALFGWGALALVADEQEGGQLSQSETLGSEADEWRMGQRQAEA